MVRAISTLPAAWPAPGGRSRPAGVHRGRYGDLMTTDYVQLSSDDAGASQRLARAQRSAERVARLVAADMDVDDWAIVVTADDAPIGTAYASPNERIIEVSISTVEHPDPLILRAVLAHEFAHLRLGMPRWQRFEPMSRVTAPVSGALAGLAVGAVSVSTANLAPAKAAVVVTAAILLGALAFAFLRHLLRLRLTARYELRCDIDAAHQVGDVWLVLLPYDPSALLDPVTRFLVSDHPGAETRAAAIRHHNYRMRCGCPVDRNAQPAI
jgi:Zn-dependent protease with chaperone function